MALAESRANGSSAFPLLLPSQGDTTVKRGQAALRDRMATWFKKAPKVHARLIGRMVQGAFVVDHERVTGTPDGKPIEGIGIYEVRNGKIVRLWWTP